MAYHSLKPCFSACMGLLLLTWCTVSFSQSSNLYDAHFRWASARFQPYLAGYDGWLRLKAQGLAESNLDPDAVSPAGAVGVMQFMKPSWAECALAFNMDVRIFSRKDPKLSIYCGGWYMDRQDRIWRGRSRSPMQRWYLNLAGYNAGAGNVIRAQEQCQNALEWWDIQPCMYMVTGGPHSRETTIYVIRITRIFDAL